jgi:cytochrome c2
MTLSKCLWFAAVFGGVLTVTGCDAPTASSQHKVEIVDPGSPGAALFVKFCSDCHAPPNVLTHTAAEWPNVIYRMQEERRMRGLHLLNENEKAELLAYLQQHAKKG